MSVSQPQDVKHQLYTKCVSRTTRAFDVCARPIRGPDAAHLSWLIYRQILGKFIRRGSSPGLAQES